MKDLKFPPPIFPGDVRVIKDGASFGARVQARSGFVYFHVTELTFSRQSIDCVLEIEIDIKGEKRPNFVQRIDLRSSSGIRSLVTDLNNAFGGKKDEKGYNWSLILNAVVSALHERIKKEQDVIPLDDIKFEEPQFLLIPFLQKDAPNLLFAQSEVGKTFFVQRLALSLATGNPFLGYPTPQGIKTLYLDYEDSPSAFAARLHKLCKGMGITYAEATKHIFYYKPGGSLRNNLEIVRRLIEERKIDLLVIDAGGDASGGSPSDEEKVIDLFNALEEIPCTKLMIHHEPKYVHSEATSFYGSMYWKARSRVAWRLELESEEEHSKLVKMTIQKKSNLPPQPALYYRQHFIGLTIDELLEGGGATLVPSITLEREDPPTPPEINIDVQILNELEKEPSSETQLAQLIGKDRSNVGKHLRTLKAKGIVHQIRKGKSILWTV